MYFEGHETEFCCEVRYDNFDVCMCRVVFWLCLVVTDIGSSCCVDTVEGGSQLVSLSAIGRLCIANSAKERSRPQESSSVSAITRHQSPLMMKLISLRQTP